MSNSPIPRPYGPGDRGALHEIWEFVWDADGRALCSLTALRAHFETTTATTAHDVLMGRLQVLNQKNAQYAAVRDIPYLLCPKNSKPMINIRFVFSEDNEGLTRVVFRCATCALLTAPARARLSVAM